MKKIVVILIFLICSYEIFPQSITNYTTANGLADNFVQCVTVDQNNNVWFGTISGVSMFDGTNWTTYNTATYPNMPNDNIKVISAMSNGDIWIGTDFGASKFDGTSWITYTINDGLTSNQIKSINEEGNGIVWIATNLGVTAFPGLSYSSPNLHWSGVNETAFDSQGNKWFSSPLGGLTSYDGGTNFTNYDTSSGLMSMYATSLLVDNQDRKWVGTGSGISVLDASNTNWTHYTIMYVLPPPDTLNPVVDIVEGSNGIWVAIYVGYLAQGGVAFFDGNNWYDWDQSDGIIGANVTGIAIDYYDNIWVSTSTGVSKISSITNINEEFYKEDIFYPIPANEVIYFNNKNLISVQIFNMLGQEIMKEEIATNQNNIEISHLEEGVYSIISNTKTYKKTQKIIIY
ncbi:MAG: two-component regulator propeller domain-containing protein [Bacteroidota bacterium]|nr:two-component regulator propeller domain-containing protein [Bacteroidota bacterium]